MRKYISSLIVLALALTFTGCQLDFKGSIKGTVTNINGDAIADANIVVVYSDGNKTTTSNENGKYFIKKLPSKGDANITVVKDGYIEIHQSIQLERKLKMDFTLEEDTNTKVHGSLSGVIKDVAGDPLEGVKVYSGAVETMTNAQGEYSLSIAVSEQASITAELENYAQNSRNVSIVENETATLDLTLVVVDVVETFDVTAGASISTKGATVEFDGGSIVNADGSAFTGNVTAKVSFNQVTSSIGREAFPGDYIGLETNGNETVLLSYGFIDVTLEDDNGNELRLADGLTATLTYPMDINIVDTPASIPLWYYDVALGIWVEDGVAIYDAGTNSYSGEVTHFTTWNLDAKVARAIFTGCIADSNAAPVTNATIMLSTAGWTRTFVNSDVAGTFTFVNAPSGTALTLSAIINGIQSSTQTFTLAAGETKTFSECIGFDASQLSDPDAVDKFSSVKGRLVFSDGTPIANQYLRINNGDTLINTYTDVNGYFTTVTFQKPTSNTVKLEANVNIGGLYINVARVFALDTLNVETNLGSIEIKAANVTACITTADGGTTFGTGSKTFSIDIPFPGDRRQYFRDGGLINFVVEKNNLPHTIYANIFEGYPGDYTLTGSKNFIANTDSIDLSSDCIVLSPVTPINKLVTADITTSLNDSFLEVIYTEEADYEYATRYGRETILEENALSGSFSVTKNGVYYIMQNSSNWAQRDHVGSMIITIEGITHSINIPANSISSSGWIGFALEVYEGNIKVIEINQMPDDRNEG